MQASSGGPFFGFQFLMGSKANNNQPIQSVGLEESVRQSIIVILSTQAGERALSPRFGSNLRKFIFRRLEDENLDAIGSQVRNAIHESEDRILIEGVSVEKDEKQRNLLNIQIRYLIKETGVTHSLRYPLKLLD